MMPDNVMILLYYLSSAIICSIKNMVIKPDICDIIFLHVTVIDDIKLLTNLITQISNGMGGGLVLMITNL